MTKILNLLWWVLYYTFGIVRVTYRNIPGRFIHAQVERMPKRRKALASHPNLKNDTIVLLSQDENIEVLEQLLINHNVVLPQPAVWNIFAKNDVLTDSLLLKRDETVDFFILDALLTRYALTEEIFDARPVFLQQQLLKKLLDLGCSLLDDKENYFWVTNSGTARIMDLLHTADERLDGFKRFIAKWAATIGILPNMARIENLPDEVYAMMLLQPLTNKSTINGFLHAAANPSVPLPIIEELLEHQLSYFGLQVEARWIGDVIKWWSEYFPVQSNALLIKHSYDDFFLKYAVKDMTVIDSQVCERLAFHPDKEVRMAIARHPSTSEDVLHILKDDEDVEVLISLVTNPNVPPECLFKVLSHEQAGVEAFEYLSLADVETNTGLSLFYYESCLRRLDASETVVSKFKTYLLDKATHDKLNGLPFAWVCKMYDLKMEDIDFSILRKRLEDVSLVTV